MNNFYKAQRRRTSAMLALYILVWVGLFFTCVVFYINEYKHCLACRALNPLKKMYIPVSCEASHENNHHLIHIVSRINKDCPLYKLQTFYPPPEFKKNLKPFKGVFFDMKVEMYQWEWNPKWFRLGLKGRWSSNLVGAIAARMNLMLFNGLSSLVMSLKLDSKSYPLFLRHTHTNPDFFPHINGVGRQFASRVFAGDFVLSRRHLVRFRNKRQLPLMNDGIYIKPHERPCTSVSYRNTHVYQNALFTGNPLSPQIGDLRITFWGSTATHVSALAQQEYHPPAHFFYENYVELGPITNLSTGTQGIFDLVKEGDHTPEELFNDYIEQRTNSNWLSRVFNFIALLTFLTIVILLTKLEIHSYHNDAYPNWIMLTSGAFFLAWGCILLSLIPFRISCDIFMLPSFFFGGIILLLISFDLWKSDIALHYALDHSFALHPFEKTESYGTINDPSLTELQNNQQYIYQPV